MSVENKSHCVNNISLAKALAGEKERREGGVGRKERLVNYSRLHPCITFSLSLARCAQRQQNTKCTKIHITLVVRIWRNPASLSALSPDDALHSIFFNWNHSNSNTAFTLKVGEYPLKSD